MQTANREPHTTQKSYLFVYFGVNFFVFVSTSFGSGVGATGAGAAATVFDGSDSSYPSIESAPNIG